MSEKLNHAKTRKTGTQAQPESPRGGEHVAVGNTAAKQPAAQRIDHLEAASGGAVKPKLMQGDLARKTSALGASTEEEVDALRLNLAPDTGGRETRNGTGRIVDELASDRIAGMTEVGPELEDRGVASLTPGRNNPSGILRRHHPDTEIARAEDVVEGNLDEPRDEARMERKVDEGTAA